MLRGTLWTLKHSVACVGRIIGRYIFVSGNAEMCRLVFDSFFNIYPDVEKNRKYFLFVP